MRKLSDLLHQNFFLFFSYFSFPIYLLINLLVITGNFSNWVTFITRPLLCLFQKKNDRPTAGKRKFDGGHQNQGESKRRFQSSWGNQPLAQQPLGNAYAMASVNGSGGGGGAVERVGGAAADEGAGGGGGGGGPQSTAVDDHEWYQDSYQTWS